MKRKRTPPNTYETVQRLAALKNLLRGEGCTREQIISALRAYDDDPQFQKFRRDCKALETLGYRVERNEFDNRYRLISPPPEADWSDAELQALAMLRELFREKMYEAGAVHAALTRLEQGMSAEQKRVYQRTPPIAVSLQATEHYESVARILRRLEKAVNKQHIAFEYQPLEKRARTRHRQIHPAQLEFRDGHYYLWGYSFEVNRYLEFRVDRIQASSLRVLPTRASAPPPHKLITVQVRLSARLARSGTIPHFPMIDSIESDKVGGGWLVTAQDYTDFRIIQKVLRYGEHAEIVSPTWLREKMRGVVEEMGRVYAKDHE